MVTSEQISVKGSTAAGYRIKNLFVHNAMEALNLFLRPITDVNAFLEMLVYKRMPRGFYSKDRLICHRSLEGKFMHTSVLFLVSAGVTF
jgi:hypothetical protein